MDISELSTQEKSTILLKLVGYKVLNTVCGEPGRVLCDPDGYQIAPGRFLPWATAVHLSHEEQFKVLCPDIYNPGSMALAWRVLNWAMTRQEWTNGGWMLDHVAWLFSSDSFLAKSPTEAQAAWLDKILELAIAAGMVE